MAPAQNSAKAAKGRGKPFPKGKSGNPGGRKPLDPEVKDALASALPGAIKKLVELVNCGDPKVEIRAVEVVLERNLGKVSQPLEHGGSVTIVVGDPYVEADE